jgi:bile acid-coenzyme A ligase
MSFPAAFARCVDRDPDGPALICDGESVSRGALERRADRLARAFAEHGVGEGDRVAIALPNSVAFVEATLATRKLGAVPTPLSPRLPERERSALLELAGPALVLGVPPDEACPARRLPLDFQPSPALSDERLPERTAPAGQAIGSGGSTGRPKLIVDAKPAAFDPESDHYGIGPGVAVLIPGPLFHTGPLMSRFDPEQALALIARHRVAWVNFVPTMLHRIWR